MAYFQVHNGLSCEQKDHDCEEWRQKYIKADAHAGELRETLKYISIAVKCFSENSVVRDIGDAADKALAASSGEGSR